MWVCYDAKKIWHNIYKVFMEKTMITPSMKLAELLEMNYCLLEVLSRFGVGLGFGEHTIAEAAESHGISVSSFLLVCNAYTYDNYVPATSLLESAEFEDLIRYLHGCHDFYIGRWMAEVEERITKLITPLDAERQKVVKLFLENCKAEMKNHFDYEEDVVFPYIRALLSGECLEGYSIEIIEENHSNIKAKLNDLKIVLMKYLSPTLDSRLGNDVLYRIFFLEEDFMHHTFVEDSILVPMVNLLESHEQEKCNSCNAVRCHSARV